MKRDLPAFVHQKPKALYFQRRGWDTVRIASPFPSPEFWREYALILQGTPPIDTSGKTFLNLIRLYQRSEKRSRLAPRTQADYQKVLTWAEGKLGPLPPAKMQRKDVIRARDANARAKRFANYIVQVLRVLLEFAIDLGWREDNPAKGVEALRYEKTARQPWPVDLVEAFRAAAPLGTRPRTIFELGIGTGQRPSDLVKMRWDDLKDGGIHVRQGKTGARLWLPLTRALREALDATKRAGLTICADATGRPTTYSAAAYTVLQVRKQIGATAYDLHSLRHTAAAELAAAGCSDDLIMSVTGHETAAMVRLYAGAARQRSRATEAMGKRDK
jgi:integrase